MKLKSFNNRQGPKDLYNGVVGRRLRGRPKADHGEESDDSIRATGLKACGEGLLSGFNIIVAAGRPPSGLNTVGAQLDGRNEGNQSRPETRCARNRFQAANGRQPTSRWTLPCRLTAAGDVMPGAISALRPYGLRACTRHAIT